MIILRRLLEALADVHEGIQDLSGFKHYLESISSAGQARFYYENILRRSPESGGAATTVVENRLDFAIQMVKSDEFAWKYISLLRMCFPERPASIFVHVPKTGGSTVIGAQELSGRYCFLHTPTDICQRRDDERANYYGKIYSELRNSSLNLAMVGHPTSRFVYEAGLRQSFDSVFATVRDPFHAVISYINYVLTVLTQADGSTDEEFLTRADVKSFRSVVGCTKDSSRGRITERVLLAIVNDLIPANMQCRAIGLEPTFLSALDTIDILGLEVVTTDHLNSFIKKQGWPDVPPMNVSNKFVTKMDLSKSVLTAIYAMIGEDLKLVNWAMSRSP